ncbi:cellulose biosynthesis protein BcsP [Cupriavidus basilensis]|uniref:cellulose biosynthesis protein BcsP n=1 Tax=Cupriavidus basilensis TaxID=68895 RepID=UPI0039F73AF5
MSQSDDLSKLFQRFGGKAESYKEIVREDAATQARERWPLLTSVRVDRAAVVPPVQPAAPPAHDVAGTVAEPAAPLWRAALPAGELPPAAEPARAAEAPAAQVAPPAASAMRPRFRTPEGMAPVASASMPRSTPEVAAAPPQPAAVANPVAAPEPEPARIWSPAAPAAAAEPARAADTELSKVFARLEGRQEPATTSERAPARRSFLDRLNRS